jgi:hypothetical protein
MRDLYGRLGVSPLASQQDLHAAIATCSNAALRRDAEAVLLRSDRKERYDRVRGLLSRVGKLRAEFGLNHAENWGDACRSDFEYSGPLRGSQLEYLRNRLTHGTEPAREIQSDKHDWRSAVWLFVGVGSVVFLAWALLSEEGRRTGPGAGTNLNPTASMLPSSTPPAPALKPQPSPPNNFVRRLTSGEPLAPLEIITSGSGDFLVKLVDTRSKRAILDLYVRGGQRAEIDVPLGTYELRYASGDAWYGYDRLFGPDTSYSKADTVFEFTDSGYQYSGYTVTLYRVSNGNLRTRTISASDF